MRPTTLSMFGTLALVTSLAAAGCAPVAPGGDGSFPGGTDGTGSTTNNNGTSIGKGAKYAGIYNANAPIDFTQDGVLPGIASPALKALSMVGSNPGRAIINLAQAQGVIDWNTTIANIVGDILTQELNGAMDQSTLDALDQISNIAKIAQTTKLTNKLTIHTPKADGTVTADLQLTGAGFDFVNIKGDPKHVDVTVSAGGLTGAKTTLAGIVKPRANAPVADADVTFQGGKLVIPIGDFLMQAAGPLIFQPEWNVTSLKDAMQKMMQGPCQTLASYVWSSAQGVVGVEYIEQGTYDKICQTVVLVAAAEIATEIQKMTIDGVTINNGRAVLYDISTAKPTTDNQSDRLADGVWTWSFGGTSVPSTLAGDRMGNAN